MSEPVKRKCKHDFGWLSVKAVSIFVNGGDPPDYTRVGFAPRNKVVMRCNYPDCSATRNAYFDRQFGGFVKFGKVRP